MSGPYLVSCWILVAGTGRRADVVSSGVLLSCDAVWQTSWQHHQQNEIRERPVRWRACSRHRHCQNLHSKRDASVLRCDVCSLIICKFLANVNYAVARPSVVCNARAPYSGGWNFRQYFYGIWYRRHPLTSTEHFTKIVSGEPLRRGS